MRFLSRDEAAELAQQITSNLTVQSDPYAVMKGSPGRFYWLAQQLASSLEYFDWCLLWVTQTEVWASSQNLHLYYALRSSYGEQSEIDQRPGQRFLRHELADLVSFIHIGMLNGWDMLLCTSHDYGRVFVSHDGWAEVVRPNGATLESLEKVFAEADLKIRTLRPAS